MKKIKFKISKYTMASLFDNKEKESIVLYEVVGEITTISGVKVGIRFVPIEDMDCPLLEFDAKGVWQIIDLETGALIVRQTKTKKQAIIEAQSKIKGQKWESAINKMRNKLTNYGIKIPVN